MSLQAVILAAGFGSRLRPLTDAQPKALIPLGWRAIIGHALDMLVEAGVGEVVVVTGHARERLEAYLDRRDDVRVVLVHNPAYATTNTLGSLACAERALHDDFLLLDGDVIFEPGVLEPLLYPGTRLAVDRGRPLDDEAVKVAIERGRIVAVGKALPPPHRAVAESIGIARIDRDTARALFRVGEALLGAGEHQAYYEAAFARLIGDGALFEPADVTGLRWVEIDDHDDLRRAEALFVAA